MTRAPLQGSGYNLSRKIPLVAGARQQAETPARLQGRIPCNGPVPLHPKPRTRSPSLLPSWETRPGALPNPPTLPTREPAPRARPRPHTALQGPRRVLP